VAAKELSLYIAQIMRRPIHVFSIVDMPACARLSIARWYLVPKAIIKLFLPLSIYVVPLFYLVSQEIAKFGQGNCP